jgi:hypothetical protein
LINQLEKDLYPVLWYAEKRGEREGYKAGSIKKASFVSTSSSPSLLPSPPLYLPCFLKFL